MPSPLGSFLGIGHIAVGAFALVAPSTAVRLFRIVPATSTAFITRAFGTRDLFLGLALTFYDVQSPEGRVAMLGCAGIHAVDVMSGAVSWAQGQLGWDALVVAGGVDAVLAGLSWWSLSG